MIKRYSTDKMTNIWSDLKKYFQWLAVEMAVLRARLKMEEIDEKTFERIKKQVCVRVERIEEIEKETKHDLLAFVMCVQESLDDDLKRYFHKDLTSFDIEEPALSLIFLEALKLIYGDLNKLSELIKSKAEKYSHLERIERTHGQHAEPNTLGLAFLWWYDCLVRQIHFLKEAEKEIKKTKISGAVGTYSGGLSPELEAKTLELLGLEPVIISGQIVLRDRHAHLMNALAVLAGVLENIAENIRLLGQTEIREVQEPFGKNQKGSSRMPHKKNTILAENLCGLARVVRHNAGIALENIVTWGGRDISHSSAERIIFVDSFQLVHFMLKRLCGVIDGLVVNKDQIKKNLKLSQGTFFSPEVRDLLMDSGADPEEAYRIAQETAFLAIEKHRFYLSVLLEDKRVREIINTGQAHEKLKKIFEIKNKLKYVPAIFARFNLSV